MYHHTWQNILVLYIQAPIGTIFIGETETQKGHIYSWNLIPGHMKGKSSTTSCILSLQKIFLGLISWAQLRLYTEIHYQFSNYLLSIMCQALWWAPSVNKHSKSWVRSETCWLLRKMNEHPNSGLPEVVGSIEEPPKTAWGNRAQLRKSEESFILFFLSREQIGEDSSRKVKKHC